MQHHGAGVAGKPGAKDVRKVDEVAGMADRVHDEIPHFGKEHVFERQGNLLQLDRTVGLCSPRCTASRNEKDPAPRTAVSGLAIVKQCSSSAPWRDLLDPRSLNSTVYRHRLRREFRTEEGRYEIRDAALPVTTSFGGHVFPREITPYAAIHPLCGLAPGYGSSLEPCRSRCTP